LKSIIEEALLDTMYEIPSRPEIKRCTITRDTIDGEGRAPVYELHDPSTVGVIEESA
jgi:ATP-dependent Clp protease ATP-binding subunit ClpX